MLRKAAKGRQDDSSGKFEDRLPAVGFLVSCVILAFLAGIFVARYRLPPARQINEALQEFRGFRQHWRNDLGLEPTRSLVDASPGRQPIAVHDAGRAYRGLRVIYLGDPIHSNDVEELGPELADAFPQFAVGDLLVSMRSLNLIAVLDGSTHDVKWWQIGPWHRQHDPDFLPDGTISVFNNNMGFGASSIVVVNPASGETRTVFAASDDVPFYTWRRGNHQHLENGNILIAESEGGRVFEVTRAGQLVWEFHNVYDEERNGVVNLALGLDEDYFEPGAPSCDAYARKPGPGSGSHL